MRLAILSLACLVIPFSPVFADEPRRETSERGKLDEETERATAKALDWLAKKQEADGSWGSSRYEHNTAITGFTLLAFMSQGHLPNKGKYGPVVEKGLKFLLNSAREDGYMIGRAGGNMYCHGMATLALTQLWGMSEDPELLKVLKRAVNLIINCQSPEGGWRYNPQPADSDISVTIMQVMALRGARDCGIHVPEKTFRRALAYIDRCHDNFSGGYSYQPGAPPGFARTAAGICVIKLVGDYEKNVDQSVQYLKRNWANPREHFWYGQYYASHAMHQVGGRDWDDYYTQLKQTCARIQADDGGYTKMFDPQGAGPVYQTAIAVIALSVPCNYLPIFQR